MRDSVVLKKKENEWPWKLRYLEGGQDDEKDDDDHDHDHER